MTPERPKRDSSGPSKVPRLGDRGETRKREREVRMAQALRANLRRRKDDLAARRGDEPVEE
jgi:hypothetical protein